MNEPLHTVRKAQWKAQQYAILKILVNSSSACQVKSLLVLHHPTCKKSVMNSLSWRNMVLFFFCASLFHMCVGCCNALTC